jgi:hypothetical protein
MTSHGQVLEGTLEWEYREKLKQIPYPRGSDERALAKREAWREYEAQVFQRDGSVDVIHTMQAKFAVEYYRLLKAFYDGKLSEQEYRRRRIVTLRRYAERLLKVGLLTGVFDDAWIRDFAQASLQRERELLPVPREFTGFTDEDAALLCNPLRTYSRRFFKAVHAEFGVGRLRQTPEIYDGVPLLDQPVRPSGVGRP